MNLLVAIGRLGKDAELRYTGSGTPVAGFSAAVDSGYGDNKQTLWLDCSLWGKRGESLAPHLTKGKQVFVQGELGQREYNGKTYLTLKVAEVKLIGSRQDGNQAQGRAPQRQPERTAAAPEPDFDDDIPF